MSTKADQVQNPIISATDTLTFVQLAERNEIEPYAVGQEFVIFLRWLSTERGFVRWSNGDGSVAAFAIENGRIRSTPIASYVGMDEEQLAKELSSLAPR
jgi:hypothetical protein